MNILCPQLGGFLDRAFGPLLGFRTGGFSTTVWGRNFVTLGSDTFGRSIIAVNNTGNPAIPICANASPTGAEPLDCSLSTSGTNELGSFGRSNYQSLVVSVNKRFSNRFQGFANYTFSKNNSNGSSERDTDSFFGPQDPINLNLDYGRSQLDLTHQFNSGIVTNLPWGFTWSNNFLYHSGLAYPVYITSDLNGDGISNQGNGTNDRPTILGSNGKFPCFRLSHSTAELFRLGHANCQGHQLQRALPSEAQHGSIQRYQSR